MTEAETGSEHESEKRSSEMTTKSRSQPTATAEGGSLSLYRDALKGGPQVLRI